MNDVVKTRIAEFQAVVDQAKADGEDVGDAINGTILAQLFNIEAALTDIAATLKRMASS